MTSTADEGVLLGRFRLGDHDAWRTLFERYAEQVRGKIRSRLPASLHRRLGVSDVVQETQVAAYEARAEFDGDTAEGFRRWLLGIAEHKALDAIRRHDGAAVRSVRREEVPPDTAAGLEVVGPAPTPSEVAVAGELEILARRARDLLPEDHQEILRLIREEGLTLAVAAVRMGRSREAAKKLYGRAVLGFKREFDRLRGAGA